MGHLPGLHEASLSAALRLTWGTASISARIALLTDSGFGEDLGNILVEKDGQLLFVALTGKSVWLRRPHVVRL